MAKFTVAASNGAIEAYEGGFDLSRSGVLIVNPSEGNQVIYGIGGWLALEVKEGDSSIYEERGVTMM